MATKEFPVSLECPARPSTFNGIQALRGFAASLVVFHHAPSLLRDHVAAHASGSAWQNGASGVDIFFVISGFVMAVSTIGKEHKTYPAQAFLERRIIRIVPLYWLMTALVLLKLAAMRLFPQIENAGIHAKPSVSFILSSLFFIPYRNSLGSLHPLLETGWTLWFEMFFYLLFALALALQIRVVRFLTPVLLLLAIVGMSPSGYGHLSIAMALHHLSREFSFA